MDIFHSIWTRCTNVLFYGGVYLINILLSSIIKVGFKDTRLYTQVKYKNNRIMYILGNGLYNFNTRVIKKGSLTNASLQLTRGLESIIKITDLKLIIHKIKSPNIEACIRKDWKTDYFNLDNDINHLEIIKKRLSNIHVIIHSLELFYENDTDIRVYFSNISIQRRRGSDDISIRIGRMKMYYKEIFIGLVNKNTIIIKTDNEGVLRKFINIDSININFFTKILYNGFIDKLRQIYEEISTDGSEILPYCRINNVRVNSYLLNYIQLNCKNIVVDNDIFKIGYILGKIWKKDSIWINDMDIHLNSNRRPEIRHLRIRLFTSTSDKLYKTFIILRKKFFPIHERKQHIKDAPVLPCNNIISSYIYNKQILSSPETYKSLNVDVSDEVLDEAYVKDLLDITLKYKLFIKSIQVDLSYNGGKIVADEVSIKTDDCHTYLYITNWVFYKHKIKYISKYNTGSSEQCIFKFNNNEMDITPYKLIIFLDTKQFSYSFNIIKDNIARLTHLFSSNFYYYNRGYIFERFYLRSFYTEFSYKKRHLRLGKLIEGNKLQLLNCLNVSHVDLILKEVIMVYPVNWEQVIKKIIRVYAGSIYEYNMDSIIKKIAGPKAVSVMNLKQNLKAFKKKLRNFK